MAYGGQPIVLRTVQLLFFVLFFLGGGGGVKGWGRGFTWDPLGDELSGCHTAFPIIWSFDLNHLHVYICILGGFYCDMFAHYPTHSL